MNIKKFYYILICNRKEMGGTSWYKCGASCYIVGRVGIMWGELAGASWHICGASWYICGASWLGRAGINMGRVGWGELVLGRIDWHPLDLIQK